MTAIPDPDGLGFVPRHIIDVVDHWSSGALAGIAAADAKAGTLLSWTGAVLTLAGGGFAAAAGQLSNGERFLLAPGVGVILLLAWAVDLLILAIRPRLDGPDGQAPVDHSFMHLARLRPAEITRLAVATGEMNTDSAPSAKRAQHIAQTALAKHLLVERATTLLRCAMPLLGVTAVLVGYGLAT